MAVVVCAAGTCFSNTGSCSGPGGPDCCSTIPGEVEILSLHWLDEQWH
jgi:hypothetical protein